MERSNQGCMIQANELSKLPRLYERYGIMVETGDEPAADEPAADSGQPTE
jgi:hypothetical protein